MINSLASQIMAFLIEMDLAELYELEDKLGTSKISTSILALFLGLGLTNKNHVDQLSFQYFAWHALRFSNEDFLDSSVKPIFCRDKLSPNVDLNPI